jgi:hypothetical protein
MCQQYKKNTAQHKFFFIIKTIAIVFIKCYMFRPDRVVIKLVKYVTGVRNM